MQKLKFSEYLKRKWGLHTVAGVLIISYIAIGIQEHAWLMPLFFSAITIGGLRAYWTSIGVCPKCFNIIGADKKYCPHCGKKVGK